MIKVIDDIVDIFDQEIIKHQVFNETYFQYVDDVSIKNNHISFEHTHPPHHYILSEDRYKTVANIKNEFKKIIYK